MSGPPSRGPRARRNRARSCLRTLRPGARQLAISGRRVARDPELLAGDLAERPVPEHRVAVAGAHRQVAEHPLHPLAGLRRARAGGPPDVALHGLPGLDVDLARDAAEPHVVGVGELAPVLGGEPAELHVLAGAVSEPGPAHAQAPPP